MNNQNVEKFEWINTTTAKPSISQDLAVRAKIRKQAMKKAADTRRATGNYGKTNLRQYPVFVVDDVPAKSSNTNFDESDGQITAVPKVVNLDVANGCRVSVITGDLAEGGFRQASLYPITGIISSISSAGYDAIRMRFGVDILELSALTATFHSTGEPSADSEALVQQFSSRFWPIQWSFVSYIPARYGEDPCLTLATDCLLSRVREILTPESSVYKPKVISNYVKALRSLQKAIDSPSQRFNPEVLCATEILALYELLDPAGKPAWIRHAAGVSRLIQSRGPENFKTEFEKCLFMAHVGPIMKEALLNNQRCFLEQDPWQRVFRSAIDETYLTERSAFVIDLLLAKSCLPGIFKDVTDHVLQTTDEETPSLQELANQAQGLGSDLMQWRRQHEKFLAAPKTSITLYMLEKRSRVYATYLSCQIVILRLIAAISFGRDNLEKEIQILVELMLNIESEVRSVKEDANMLYLVQVIDIAHASKATTQEWAAMSESEMEKGLVERSKFERWCKLFGRKV